MPEYQSWIDLKDLEPEQGWDLKMYLDHDPFVTPDDDEGITAKQREAWNKDEWCYVNVLVKVFREGIELGSYSYGGIEYGWFTETDENDNVTGSRHIGIDNIIDYVGGELAGEAIWHAEQTLRNLIKATWKRNVECPNHGGAFDCTPFCHLCNGTQEIQEESK